ncbi:MAG: hypothetical protein IKD31_02650 [Clostridia bacterium]|nr:hypothetical protein [Clostridia bacterium]
MVEKYKIIFPEINTLTDEQLKEHFSVHMLKCLSDRIANEKNSTKRQALKEETKKLLVHKQFYSLDELTKRGFREEDFYESLKKLLL